MFAKHILRKNLIDNGEWMSVYNIRGKLSCNEFDYLDNSNCFDTSLLSNNIHCDVTDIVISFENKCVNVTIAGHDSVIGAGMDELENGEAFNIVKLYSLAYAKTSMSRSIENRNEHTVEEIESYYNDIINKIKKIKPIKSELVNMPRPCDTFHIDDIEREFNNLGLELDVVEGEINYEDDNHQRLSVKCLPLVDETLINNLFIGKDLDEILKQARVYMDTVKGCTN